VASGGAVFAFDLYTAAASADLTQALSALGWRPRHAGVRRREQAQAVNREIERSRTTATTTWTAPVLRLAKPGRLRGAGPGPARRAGHWPTSSRPRMKTRAADVVWTWARPARSPGCVAGAGVRRRHHGHPRDPGNQEVIKAGNRIGARLVRRAGDVIRLSPGCWTIPAHRAEREIVHPPSARPARSRSRAGNRQGTGLHQRLPVRPDRAPLIHWASAPPPTSKPSVRCGYERLAESGDLEQPSDFYT